MAGLVGQPRRSSQIANGINTGLPRGLPSVYLHMTAIDLNLGVLQAQILNITNNAHRHDNPVDNDTFGLAVGCLDRGCNINLGLFKTFDLNIGQYAHALLLKGLMRHGRYFLVLHWQYSVQHFNNRHFGSQSIEKTSKFDTNGTRSHHQQPFGNYIRHQGMAVIPDLFAIRLHSWQVSGPGASSQDDMLGTNLQNLSAVDLYADATFAQQAGMAVQHINLVLLQQMANTTIQLFGHPAAAFYDCVNVNFYILDLEAIFIRRLGQMINLGRAQQCLGRNTAPVQANTAQVFSLDNRHGHSQLRAPDRRYIAPGSGTNDY